MKESTKNNFLLPFIVLTIGTFILSPIANALFDPKKKEIPFVTPALKFLSFIWNDVLNYKISIWVILIVVLIIGVILYLKPKKKESIQSVPITPYITKEPEIIKPDYLRYTNDVLKSWRWNWKYKTIDFGKVYTIEELVPVCSICNMKTIEAGYNFL